MTQENLPIVNLQELPDVRLPAALRWEGTFGEYLGRVLAYPETVRTAFQRLYATINYFGKREYTHLREKVVHYNMFEDPFTPSHEFAVYDIDRPIMQLVRVVEAGANRYGQEKRIILLHGPVGGAKSTIATLLSVGLEEYSRTDEGQTYMPFWHVEKGDAEGIEILGTLGEFEKERFFCPLHEEPLRVLPRFIRSEVLKHLNAKIVAAAEAHGVSPWVLEIEGDACPRCDDIFDKLLRRYGGNWKEVVEKHLGVARMVFSRAKRVGIAGVRPKSEKDQDAAELSGETNYAALAKFGDTVDPRTFSFRGHFESANRGIFYGEEMLKAVLGFLYDYLGASQEHRIQPRGFMEIDVDEVILGSTNPEEYDGLRKNEKMAALRDRIVKVDVPYTLRLSGEVKIYQKFFNPQRCHGKHLAPLTIETAACWGVLTRLTEPQKAGLTLRDKMRLYNGQPVAGYNDDSIRELMKEAAEEGMRGISPRFIHDQLSNAFVDVETRECVNPFAAIRQIKNALPHHQHISSKELREKFERLLALAEEELTDTLKRHLRQAVVGDEGALKELFGRYIDQVMAYRHKEKVKNPVTGKDEEPDVEFMNTIESMIGVTTHDEFREKILNQMAKRARDRERDPNIPPFDWKADERLRQALELYLFDHEKSKINWEAAISRRTLSDDDQKKIDLIRQRLCEMFGYCPICAAEVIAYVASIFHRGEKAEKRH